MTFTPDGQYWLVTSQHKRPRNPQAAHANALIHHYGWVRRNAEMNKKLQQVSKYCYKAAQPVSYGQFDPNYRPNDRESRHHLLQVLDRFSGLDFSRKHFKLVT